MSGRYQEGFCAGYRKALIDHQLVESDEPQLLRDLRLISDAWYANYRREHRERVDELFRRRAAGQRQNEGGG